MGHKNGQRLRIGDKNTNYCPKLLEELISKRRRYVCMYMLHVCVDVCNINTYKHYISHNVLPHSMLSLKT